MNIMIKKLVFVLLIGILFMSCGGGENEKMQMAIDSLTQELEKSHEVANTLQEVGVLMDSIDANRQLLRVNMVEGTSFNDYTARMNDINNYVKDSQKKIEDLENALKKSRGTSNAFSSTIKKLKADLESRNKEILELQAQVDKYRNENQNLIQTVTLQEAELGDKEAKIIQKEQELALIEARIQELMIQSKMSEGDSYYARGEAIEEAANRTKLAPKKKKETYQEALEMYKKALSLGVAKAQAKITEMEDKVK
jgi:chromosome segregation ATPase